MKLIRLLLVFFSFGIIGILNSQVYTTSSICTGLQQPVAFDFSPDGRIFLTTKGDGSIPAASGTAMIKVYSATGTFISNFYDLSDSVNSDFERGLLGIAIDPDFTTNHFVFTDFKSALNNYFSSLKLAEKEKNK